MPLLWTWIDLDYITGLDDPLLQLQLRLSRTHNLKVIGTALEAKVPNSILDIYATRVAEIALMTQTRHLAGWWLRHFPVLSPAYIDIADLRRTPLTTNALRFLMNAPALRCLNIGLEYRCTNEDVESGLAVPALPFLQPPLCLIHLTLRAEDRLPVFVFLPAISLLTLQAQEMATFNATAYWKQKTHTCPFEMPCLRTIVLKMYMHKLLLYITAPRLATVTLVGNPLCEGDPSESLLDLLRRPQAPIRSFELQDPMNGSADMLLGCLERMEGLHRMRLENASSKAKKITRMLQVLDRLACSEDRPPVLPALRSLCLHMRGRKLLKTAPSELIESATRLRRSRARPQICAGRAVAVMEEFEANVQDLADMSF